MNPLDDTRIAKGMRTQLAQRRERLDAGEAPLGWKIGFGAPGAMEKLRLAGPLAGFLMQKACVESGGTVSLAGWAKPVAEPEVAIYMGRDLPAGADATAAAAAIAAIGPAIELADLHTPPEDVEAILAGNIYQRAIVLGPRDTSRAGARLDGLAGRVQRRGAEVARVTDLEANTGRIVDIVRHLADTLAACGERLRAGELIIAGSIVPPLFIEPDEDAVAYALDPIGEISVRFTRG